MNNVKECLLIKSGLAVTTSMDSLDENDAFSFEIVNGSLFYKNNILALPVSDAIMEHLLLEDNNRIFFYGGEDPLARQFLGELSLMKDALVYAQGALWAMRKDVKNSPCTFNGMPAPGDDKTEDLLFGLPAPPDVQG